MAKKSHSSHKKRSKWTSGKIALVVGIVLLAVALVLYIVEVSLLVYSNSMQGLIDAVLMAELFSYLIWILLVVGSILVVAGIVLMVMKKHR
jgi:hypothetical protein